MQQADDIAFEDKVLASGSNHRIATSDDDDFRILDSLPRTIKKYDSNF